LLYYHIKDIVSFFYSEIPCQKWVQMRI
jgi:hypothetical protein